MNGVQRFLCGCALAALSCVSLAGVRPAQNVSASARTCAGGESMRDLLNISRWTANGIAGVCLIVVAMVVSLYAILQSDKRIDSDTQPNLLPASIKTSRGRRGLNSGRAYRSTSGALHVNLPRKCQ